MKISQLLLSLTLISLSCHEERIILKGCCQNESLGEAFGNAYIYLPNIFTPNDDGVNDLFYVLGDSIVNVIAFEVRGRKDKLVFEVKNVEANDHTKAWDGKIDGVVQKGLYSVVVTVEALDGTIRNFESEVCNYPCGLMEGEELISMEGCHFPIEWDCWLFEDGCQYFEYPGCFK